MRAGRTTLMGMCVAAVATAAGFSVATRSDAGGMEMGPTGQSCTSAVSLSISARNAVFDRDCLAAPPGESFTIVFDNLDTVSHNVVILPRHDSPETLFRGEAIDGPRSVTYSVELSLPL
jgi:plastocyanin